MAMNAKMRDSRGFTLLELMVTLTVAAVLAVVAIPSFRDLLRKNRVSSANNALLADLSYARSEAITRGSIVSICPSSDGSSCASDKQNYEGGWIIYTYTPGNAVAATDFDATHLDKNILLRYSQARAGVSLRSTASADLSFGQQGQTLPATSTYTFWTCFMSEGDAAGSSTDRVPGASLAVSGSGSVSSQKLGVQATCTP